MACQRTSTNPCIIFVSFFLVFSFLLDQLAFSQRQGLSGSIVDGESGKPVTARIRLSQGTQPILPAGFTFYDRRGERHFYVPSTFRFPLEPGQYTIRIERGKEFRPVEETFAVLAGEEVRRSFKLDRWINMESRGWYSADLHVHRPAEVMAETLLGEDLNIAPVISTHHWTQWDA